MTPISKQDSANITFPQLLSDENLVEALTKLKITTPTPVQAASIPLALEGRDLIVEAQTGSGKTFAFTLPILSKIKGVRFRRATLALIITPTRELALQVKEVIRSIVPGLNPPCIIGGAKARRQEDQLGDDARIVVGTPGRILDFIRQRVLDLSQCQTYVLDEADEMLSMGFLDDVREILSKLPRDRQGLFFSATITGRVLSLASSFLKNPKTIRIETSIENTPKIEHFFCTAESGVTNKAQVLVRILNQENPQSAIVFCNTKSDTELAEVFLKRRGINAKRINSDLNQKEREQVLQGLRDGKLRILIATDVAARGIDVKDIELVVNYSLHKDAEVYVHRTGRTGRAGASGKAISILSPQDLVALNSVKRSLGIEINELKLVEEDKDLPKEAYDA